MQKIMPCLWFDSEAEEAAQFYTSVFKNSKIIKTAYYGDSASQTAGRPKNSVMTVVFEINGQEIMALNGGPHFKLSPAMSLVVSCETQKEIDDVWSKLSADKNSEQCGWLKDKYGLSWQVVPAVLDGMVRAKDTVKSDRVMKAMLQMKKLDIETLKQAFMNNQM